MNQTHRKFPTSLLPFCSCAQSFQSSPALCSPMDCSPPGSSVHEIFPARILKCTSKLSSRISSRPMGWTCVSCISYIAGGFFTAEPPGNSPLIPSAAAKLLLQSWLGKFLRYLASSELPKEYNERAEHPPSSSRKWAHDLQAYSAIGQLMNCMCATKRLPTEGVRQSTKINVKLKSCFGLRFRIWFFSKKRAKMNDWINKNALVISILFSKRSRHFRCYSYGNTTC